MKSLYRVTAAGLMLAALAGATGCASTSDMNALRADMQSDIDKANATASQAAADAAAARQEAAAARAAAEQANATAQDTNEKLDRMFKKSMYK
ncbi:Lpp/OprI family alanine-zipper lipoprotein [Haliea sp. E17]|uniref:Lpp/OprI family alanine-zipper lipoprotein n=1 Tax=Haliea sp. E17 TaxID=3401576 RepID=UPI003AAF62D8